VHIDVDRDACCGSGNCVRTAPRVFDQDDRDGLVLLIEADPPAEVHALVREAAHLCPSGAILLSG
jgi:ferredoxin